jgi:hypothetical protein
MTAILNASDPADEVLTIVSAGLGQDSSAIVYRMGEPAFRARWAPGRIIVVFAATGDEHDDTDAYVPELAAFCAEHDMRFEHLTLDRGYHPKSWRTGLAGVQQKNCTIGTVGFVQSCTDNLKIVPIYNFVAEYCAETYGGTAYGKKSLYAYRALHGKLRVLIGFAAGEESRIAKAADFTCKRCDGYGTMLFSVCSKCRGRGQEKPRRLYMEECIEKVYPLAEIGWNRQNCQDYILSIHKPLPPPSLCFRCMWKDEDEILWSWMVYPERFAEWEADEAAKLAKFAYLPPDKNYGVKGAGTTLKAIRETRLAYYYDKGWTWDPILAHLSHYRMSHGHCVKSMY